MLHILEDADYVLEKNLICLSSQNDQIFNRFKSDFHFIIAAGGLVKNEKNKFLMIYKNNYWDLPKGKLDGQEIDKDTAFREVKEETNVSGLKIISDSFSTYHLYKMDSIIYLKETRWFLMETSSQSQLIPQIKEGIINVSWLSLKEIKKIKTYNSIHSVFDFFHYVLM